MSKAYAPDSSSVVGSGVKMESSERPLIVAAYRYGEPFRKRRVKVPPNIKWKEFLALIYSRLEIDSNCTVEIYDEQGIEIVDVDDLVENDVLVVRDMPPSVKSSSKSLVKGRPTSVPGVWPGMGMGREVGGGGVGEPIQHRLLEQSGTPQQGTSFSAAATGVRSHDKSHDLSEHSMMVSTPQLSHFIQLNSFGYYFLAEVENMKLVPTHGKIKKIHCIVKVPHCQKEAPQTFSNEAELLRKVSNHKSIVSPPSIQILNFSDDSLQHFFSTLLQQKQVLVRELFMSGGCMEAYIYPLYGVTMATRIKNGLLPDKVLKYSYQLADIMFYLQQRGVIHQNLLPENIQVMSNDRVVLCNFETAVQTDPTSCLLVAPQSVVAPGNRKGLAPEVVRSFSQLRVESECIDYSTQYPWSFGILSAVMATGLHPLKDYPENFEKNGNKVKYRSQNYQALPDSEQYPPIFCKLVKRSLSCDPIRRPTLPQILSIMKKDSKVVTLMTGKRLGGPSSSVAVQQRGVASGSGRDRRFWGSMESINRCPSTGGEVLGPSKIRSSKLNQPPSSSSKDFYDTHPPFSGSNTSYQPPTNENSVTSDIAVYRKSSSLHQQHPLETTRLGTSRSHLESQEKMAAASGKNKETSDLFLSRSVPLQRKQRLAWDTFGDEQGDKGLAFFPLDTQPNRSPPMGPRHEGLMLRRHSSSGAFSDDFVLQQISRESSARNIPQAVQRVSSGSRTHGSSERLIGRSGTTSESDLSQIQEFQYHRLGNSPDERSSLFNRSDQERLTRVSSPEAEQDLSCGMLEYSYRTRQGRTRAQAGLSPELSPRSKVARSNSYQRKAVDGKLKVESPLSLRRCVSADKPLSEKGRVGGDMEAESMDVATAEPPTKKANNQNTPPFPELDVTPPLDKLGKQVQSESFSVDKHSALYHHQQHTNNSPSTSPDGILMSNSTVGNTTTNTETQTTSMSLNQSQRVEGTVEGSGSEFIERMDTQSGRDSSEERACLLSPVLSSMASRSEVTPVSNQTFWSGILADSRSSKSASAEDESHYRFSMEDSSVGSGRSEHKQNHHQSAQKPRNSSEGATQDEDIVMISPVTLHSQTGLDIFPNALSLETNPAHSDGGVLHDEVSCSVRTSQVPLLGGEDEELTPQEDGNVEQQHQLPSRLEASARDVAVWVHEDLRRVATSQAAGLPLSPPGFTAQDIISTSEGGLFYPPAHRDYSMMSPIPEASQELTSSVSMSQSNANIHRLSGSHLRSQSRIRSVSPISEQANMSGVDEASPPPRHRSVSPFQHSAMSTNDQISTQRSHDIDMTREHGSTAERSAVVSSTGQQQHFVDTVKTAATASGSSDMASCATPVVKDQDQGGEPAHVKDNSSNFLCQSRSRSATPQITSGANSREGSIVSIRRGALQTDRPSVHTETNLSPSHPTTVEQLSGTSSGSREASLTSSASTRAQVAIDMSSAVRALISSQTAHPSSTHRVHPRPQSVTNYSREPIRSSSESLGQGSQVRGTTPQSTSSAPAQIQHNIDPSQFHREVSPHVTTTTAHRHNIPQPRAQHQAGPVAAAQTSKRYSQQRATEMSTRSHQRIHQDIEMMHLAISGMDATTQGSGNHTRNDVVDMVIGPRGPALMTQMQATTTRSVASSATAHVPTSRTMASVESGQTFRPITPVVMDVTSRPSSAPIATTAVARPSTFTPIPISSSTVQQHQRHHSQQSQPPSIPSIATVSQTVATSSETHTPQPPHVSVDSYDYLPPYSPPQNGGGRRPQNQQEQAARLQPPRDQQRTQNRQGSEPPLYPEPPPSYDEIFGGNNSGGRQRRRRGQRRQHGAESSNETNDSGSRQSRSELRRSTSQNEGPIRPSSSQRRLASLTNLFRRAKRHTLSGNSHNQQTVRSQTTTPNNDTSRPMDANEYVASWVESYSRTPRPAEAMEARAEAMAAVSVGNTMFNSQLNSQIASDITNSRPHPTAYRGPGGGAGGNPIPYRPPPPFPTSESVESAVNSSYPPPVRGYSQLHTDYSLALNRASSDVGHSRISRNSSQLPRPSSVIVGYQHTRPNTAGNAGRRGMPREHQRRPASAMISSEAIAANIVGVQPTHSGMELRTGGETRLEGGALSSSVQQHHHQQQVASGCESSVIRVSTSCFNITSPEPPVSEHRQSQSTNRNQEPSAPSRLRQEAVAPQAEEEQRTSPVREPSELRQQGQGVSLSQGPQSQVDSSNLVANVNANNINTSASPRASNASSPINMASVIGSNSSLRHNSQPISPVPPVSRDSNSVVLSQPLQMTILPYSPTNDYNSETRTSSRLSTRAAARHRAEIRLSQQDVSSSDEESSQISERSQSGVIRPLRHRQRRRRSQGSTSQAESLRSSSRQDVQLSQTRPAGVVVEETETNFEPHAPPLGHSPVNETDVQLNGTVVERVEEEQHVSTVEVAIEDVSEGSNQNQQALLSSGKSCGHSCEAESQPLCCICTVEQGAVQATEDDDNIVRALSNCSLCQRRCNSDIQQTQSYSNKIHSHSEARSSNRATAAREVVTQRHRGGKNCVVM